MAATSSMAHELVSLFSHSNYKEYCQYLTERDAVSLEHFGNTMLGKSFWIDVRRCFNQSGLNTSHVLEIFGQFSDQNPEDLRERGYKHCERRHQILGSPRHGCFTDEI